MASRPPPLLPGRGSHESPLPKGQRRVPSGGAQCTGHPSRTRGTGRPAGLTGLSPDAWATRSGGRQGTAAAHGSLAEGKAGAVSDGPPGPDAKRREDPAAPVVTGRGPLGASPRRR